MRCCYVFFFKQKTAYEMRISDWSSDVCSSDLRLSARPFVAAPIYPVQSMHAPLAHPGSRALLIGANASLALESAHTPAENVPAHAPSFVLSHDEHHATVPSGTTLALPTAWPARGSETEHQQVTEGGHGFGR